MSFNENTNNKISKAKKSKQLLYKVDSFLLCSSLLVIYQSFRRSSLDYGDAIYDQPSHALFSNEN